LISLSIKSTCLGFFKVAYFYMQRLIAKTESWLMMMLAGSPSVGGDRSAMGVGSRFGRYQEWVRDGASKRNRQR
jgi:hypothetical protein